MKRLFLTLLLVLMGGEAVAQQCPPQHQRHAYGQALLSPDKKLWIRFSRQYATNETIGNPPQLRSCPYNCEVVERAVSNIYAYPWTCSNNGLANFTPESPWIPIPNYRHTQPGPSFSQCINPITGAAIADSVVALGFTIQFDNAVRTGLINFLNSSDEYFEFLLGQYTGDATNVAGDCGNLKVGSYVYMTINFAASGGEEQSSMIWDLPIINSSVPVTMTAPVITTTRNNCVWCHRNQPYPADINMTATNTLRKDQLPLLWFAVEQGLAPFVKKLLPADVNVLKTWVDANGFNTPRTVRPTNFGWMQEHFIGVAGQPPNGWYFTLEDGWIDGLGRNGGLCDHRFSVLPEKKDTDQIKRTLVLQLAQNRITDPDSFNTSSVSNVYGTLGRFQRHHGSFYDYQIEGDVLGYYNGRNIGINFLVENLQPPTRTNRRYVKLIIDRDGVFLRTAPMTGGEKHPFGADTRLVGNISKVGGMPAGDQWLHVKIETKRINSTNRIAPTDTMGTIVRAQVSKVYNNQVLADLYGVMVNDTLLTGHWGVAKYDTGTVWWAGLRAFALIDTVGAGMPSNPTPAQRRARQQQVNDPTDSEDTDFPGTPNP